MTDILTRAVGTPLDRADGIPKITGEAHYAGEYPIANLAHACPVQATVAAGRVTAIDTSAAQGLDGVLAVLTHENAPRMVVPEGGMAEIGVLQSAEVGYRGQFVAAVVATSWETAREAAALVRVSYAEEPHDVELRTDGDRIYRPDQVNAGYATDSSVGDTEPALAAAPITVDHTYTTPTVHNNPLEPHTTIAVWQGEDLTLYDSNQGPHVIRNLIANAFELPVANVRVVSPYVGGGFGSKVFPHPHVALAIMSAKVTGRPVKLALTRQQMYAVAGYRTPTIQRIRLGADESGTLLAISHDAVQQTSMHHEFAEQTAAATRYVYAAPNIATTHLLARLNVPVPAFMRAPGEAPGMFGLESAIDELALACGVDPVLFRLRNVPTVDPLTGKPFSSNGIAECLRVGAERFGWSERMIQPRRDGRWLVGSGVALSTYPARRARASATIVATQDGGFELKIGASDIGNGSTTVLGQIAADELRVPVERVRVRLGDTDLPMASPAGGSMGTSTWGSAVADAAANLLARLDELTGAVPPEGVEASGVGKAGPEAQEFSMHAFGAQFAEVRVDVHTGEVRVPRMLGRFGCGRIMNPKLARSQLIGGMTMGISMALHEESVLDREFGDYLNHDLAGYHIAANADIGEIEADFIEEHDEHVNPLGIKGVGEIGIVGTAAAIANAVAHATGIRIRDLPLRPDRILAHR